MRKVMGLWAVALALALSGCPGDEGSPCTTCPRVEGVWFLQYSSPDAPCDGGVFPVPSNTTSFTRQGSVLRTVVDGVDLSGTLYDTFDLSLTGQSLGGDKTVQLRAKYVPPSHADAGDETLVSGHLLRSNAACQEDRRFTGARF